jgi:hypothetical protein
MSGFNDDDDTLMGNQKCDTEYHTFSSMTVQEFIENKYTIGKDNKPLILQTSSVILGTREFLVDSNKRKQAISLIKMLAGEIVRHTSEESGRNILSNYDNIRDEELNNKPWTQNAIECDIEEKEVEESEYKQYKRQRQNKSNLTYVSVAKTSYHQDQQKAQVILSHATVPEVNKELELLKQDMKLLKTNNEQLSKTVTSLRNETQKTTQDIKVTKDKVAEIDKKVSGLATKDEINGRLSNIKKMLCKVLGTQFEESKDSEDDNVSVTTEFGDVINFENDDMCLNGTDEFYETKRKDSERKDDMNDEDTPDYRQAKIQRKPLQNTTNHGQRSLIGIKEGNILNTTTRLKSVKPN